MILIRIQYIIEWIASKDIIVYLPRTKLKQYLALASSFSCAASNIQRIQGPIYPIASWRRATGHLILMDPSILWPGFVWMEHVHSHCEKTIATSTFTASRICLLYSVLPLCSISIHVYLPFRLSFSGGLKPLKCLFLFLFHVQIDGHLHSFQRRGSNFFGPDSNRIVWVMVMPSRKRDDKKWPNTRGLGSICNPNLFWPWSWHCTPCLPCRLSCKAVIVIYQSDPTVKSSVKWIPVNSTVG